MKLLFVHDHKFRRVNGRVFSPGGLPDEVLCRYKRAFGEVCVIGRILEESSVLPGYQEIVSSGLNVHTADKMKELMQDCDGVIARLPSLNGYRAVCLAMKMGKPWLVEAVGCAWDAFWNHSLLGKLAALPAWAFMRFCLARAPFAVYVTREFLQRRYPCPGQCTSISDVMIQTQSSPVHAVHKARLADKERPLILGTAASINVAYKGQEYVLRALVELERRLGRPVEYQLVGQGSPERLLRLSRKLGVEDRVRVLGCLSHEQVFDWMDGLDIYVQPSLVEGLCRSLVEAMGRGLPCVASSVGGNVELLDSDFLYSVRPVHGMEHRFADCVCRLEDRLAEQGEHNYHKAMTDYRPDVLERRRDAFYAQFADAMRAAIHDRT